MKLLIISLSLWKNTISDLEASRCVEVEEESVAPANLGLIATYYYSTNYTTVECFRSSLTSKTKLKGLLEIMASASEHEQQLTVRPGEEELIRRLIDHQRFSFENSKIIGPSEKANALLQAHFLRQTIGGDLLTDQKEVVRSTRRG